MNFRIVSRILVCSILWAIGACPASAATIIVTTSVDEDDGTIDPGTGQGASLREAINFANGNPGADEIVFAPALAGAEFSLTLFDSGVDAGELGPTAFSVSSEITITGPSGDLGITLKRFGNNNFRLFHVRSTGSLTLVNLALRGGFAQGGHGGRGSGGAGGAAGLGGAILNEGTLTIELCTLYENEARGGSGGFGGGGLSPLGGGGGGGGGENGGAGTQPVSVGGAGLGGDPNGGATASANGGVGGGGAGGNGDNTVGSHGNGGDGGAGGLYGGGGGGGYALSTGGGQNSIAGDGGDGGFGGGGGGGGVARSTAGTQTPGAAGMGGFGAGNGLVGGIGDNGLGGPGGGAAGLGGAIFNGPGATLTLTNSTISTNLARGGDSGGVDEFGFPTGSLAAGFGGSGFGGAIFNRHGTVSILNSTIALNTVAGGQSSNAARNGSADGGIFNLGDGATAECGISNSIVVATTGGLDFSGNTINAGVSTTYGVGNLIQTSAGFAGTVVSTANPQLGELANNRGPTPTHELLAGSPAIDFGDDASAAGLGTDQRGGIFLRLADGDLDGTAHVDIGAFERVLIDYGDAPDFVAGTGAASILLPTGADDFRISVMGDDAESNPSTRGQYFGSNPQVAYNATDNEFLVVWAGDDNAGGLVDNEREIFAQRVDAQTGAKIGAQRIVSGMGPVGDINYGAFNPAVAWNSTANQYLVVWYGDDNHQGLVDNEFEIFGQVINNVGTFVGGRSRVSSMGPNGDIEYRADNPDVAYNATDNQYLVVWRGDTNAAPLVDNEREVFGQRLNSNGTVQGSPLRISVMGNDAQADPALRIGFQAIDPRVAWNSANNQFLVVWQGEDDTAPLVDNEFEVFGRIVTHTGVTTGTQQRLSVMGPDGDVNYRAAAPDLAYNPDDNEFLVVWYGDDNTGGPIDDENEVFARRVNAQSGALAGGQFRVSEAGGTGNTSFGAFNPAVAYNQAGGSYFIVWRADMAVDNKWDIYGRRVSGAGSALDPTDVRISSMGPEEDTLFGGFNATIALNSADQQYLIAWNGDDDTPPLVDGETEVFGQLIADVALIDYQTRGADDGPAHRITTGLRIGALIDSETDGRPSFAADGDDLLETDDEDGPTTTPVRIVTGPAPNPLIAVSVTNTLGVSATLYGWVDYNGDGVFDNATERGSAAVPSAGGPLSAPPLLLPAVPDNATTLTFLRLRLSTDPAAANPTGLADDGEVEDYVVEIVPPPAPEIAIRGNGIEIADGDTSPTVADHRDFGTADALTTVVVHTLLIDNGAGAADLALLTSPPVQLSGVGTDQFVVLTQPAQNPVPAGASTPLDIMFRPTRLGTHTATVVIQSNDSDESVYTFSVIGRSFQYGAGNGLGLVLNYLLGITSDPTGLDYNNDGAVDIGDAVDRVNN